MQSPNAQELHKAEPEGPIPPLIVESTDLGNQDPPLPTTEPMNDENPSPQPADSIVTQAEANLVASSKQASLAPQAHDQNKDVFSAQQNYELESQQDAIPHVYPDDDSAIQHLTEDEDDHGDGVDDHDERPFSDYGSDSSSFYSSLLSEATDYYWENGRRYHAHQGGRYLLPNDEVELDREDMKHHEWMLITDFRLHLSPIGNNPQRILDIGTGTGIWAMQVGKSSQLECLRQETDISS